MVLIILFSTFSNGCGKFYRHSSTMSIRAHRVKCSLKKFKAQAQNPMSKRKTKATKKAIAKMKFQSPKLQKSGYSDDRNRIFLQTQPPLLEQVHRSELHGQEIIPEKIVYMDRAQMMKEIEMLPLEDLLVIVEIYVGTDVLNGVKPSIKRIGDTIEEVEIDLGQASKGCLLSIQNYIRSRFPPPIPRVGMRVDVLFELEDFEGAASKQYFRGTITKAHRLLRRGFQTQPNSLEVTREDETEDKKFEIKILFDDGEEHVFTYPDEEIFLVADSKLSPNEENVRL
mmetsp:Transcript_38520/g.64648  ORF Transcript_38520/g.64648 Transcript_38520/m.64648 type:complete len:283 (+) Transcript_38520:101-949(+)